MQLLLQHWFLSFFHLYNCLSSGIKLRLCCDLDWLILGVRGHAYRCCVTDSSMCFIYAYSIFVHFQVSKCAFAVILIGVYWVLEVMPIAVTSLIPIFLFPLMGIMPSADVCSNYANVSTSLLFRCSNS